MRGEDKKQSSTLMLMSPETRVPQAGVPEQVGRRTKWQIALEEIDRLLEVGVSFGDLLTPVSDPSVPSATV
jgi:hypothetical protein